MRGKGALVLLLFAGGALVYAAGHQRRETAQARHLESDSGPRLVKIAAHRDDAFAWIGALPASFSEEMLARRLDGVLTRMMRDVPAEQDTDAFVCKRPAEVGPVPMLEAVDAYLRALPDSRTDPVLLRNLHRAAQRGNWLAKVQVYLLLSERPAPDDASAYRTLKLMEWMQEERIGALYAAVGDVLAASKYRDERGGGRLSRLDIYAAMHHHYPSQFKVGRELVRAGDPRQAAIGRRMLDCAAGALPAYRALYGEAVALRQ
ncbi:hypothetical protein IP92_01912 [Pseudoduganella flava]|uniref:Sel1 repeat family protein n=1 Tax=Pseudoduganella flava TaxID=871742 RepID=A0A562PWH0_9BURK|nr:hypothetical protein [Pseudoduganella flava]QGZ39621.1 hypothetical protein GO485_11565 [Pseudoduganella flava]TWI48520.1 hypothetical protein IP92_01912 [Pseudoduganella flava]